MYFHGNMIFVLTEFTLSHKEIFHEYITESCFIDDFKDE